MLYMGNVRAITISLPTILLFVFFKFQFLALKNIGYVGMEK
jgi:hypothetical protein